MATVVDPKIQYVWIRFGSRILSQFGSGINLDTDPRYLKTCFTRLHYHFETFFLTMMVPCIRSSLLSMIHLQKEKTNIKCPIYSRVANWGIRIHKVVVYRSNLDPDIHNWGWVQLFGRKNQQKNPFLFKTRKVLILLNNRKRA